MLEIFQKTFLKDAALSVGGGEHVERSPVTDWDFVIDCLGGTSFERGLYRVIRASDMNQWNARIAIAFPDFNGRAICFGFDWLGRAFAIDLQRLEGGQPGVVMFEPGTGEALEIPCNIASFHDEELIDYRDAALASNFHQRWLVSGGAVPGYDQCVGYKKPLFLSGADELSNLELSDIDVYWHLAGQLIASAKRLPLGAQINVGSA